MLTGARRAFRGKNDRHVFDGMDFDELAGLHIDGTGAIHQRVFQLAKDRLKEGWIVPASMESVRPWYFDMVVSCSREIMGVNREALSGYCDRGRFRYAKNTIDTGLLPLQVSGKNVEEESDGFTACND